MSLLDSEIKCWEYGKDYYHKYEFTNVSWYRKYPENGLTHIYYLRSTDVVYWEVYLNENTGLCRTAFLSSYPYLSLSPVTSIELNNVSHNGFLKGLAVLWHGNYSKDIIGGISFYKVMKKGLFYKETSEGKIFVPKNIPFRSDEKAFTVYVKYYNDIKGKELHKGYRFIQKLIDTIEISHQLNTARNELHHVESPLKVDIQNVRLDDYDTGMEDLINNYHRIEYTNRNMN